MSAFFESIFQYRFMEKFIDVMDLSELIGLKPFTIRLKCRQRRLPHYKIDGLFKFRITEINEWLETKKRKVIRYPGDIKVDIVREIRIK